MKSFFRQQKTHAAAATTKPTGGVSKKAAANHHKKAALATNVQSYVEALTEAFWPGPLTLVCEQQPSLTWDLGETRGTVAVRMPDHEVALAVLERVTDQIGSQLGEPVCIPEARQLPFLSNIEAPFRERAGMLLQNPLQDLPEIALLGA